MDVAACVPPDKADMSVIVCPYDFRVWVRTWRHLDAEVRIVANGHPAGVDRIDVVRAEDGMYHRVRAYRLRYRLHDRERDGRGLWFSALRDPDRRNGRHLVLRPRKRIKVEVYRP